jgi:mannose-6-phosphate isomerase-like protein (cupin superfamily)
MKRIEKPWGHEVWLELNDDYCYKRIYFKAGNQCSLQYHQKKLETIYVESGEGLYIGELVPLIDGSINPLMAKGTQSWETIKINNSIVSVSIWTVPIAAGDFFTIHPNMLHRIKAITDLTTLEVSTPEVDDCIRVLDDTNRPNGRIESEHEQV